MSAARQRGLTLVELLVALGIFALVSAASAGVLALAVGGQEQLEASTDELSRLERTRSLLRSDLFQTVNRPVRDEEGGAVPAFAGGDALPDEIGGPDDERTLLVLTRSGWTNPDGAYPRAELQRVEYLVREGTLLRRTRPYLDAAAGTPAAEEALLSGLTDVELGFWDGTRWAPGYASGQGPFAPAVRLAFTHPSLGSMRFDMLVGGA